MMMMMMRMMPFLIEGNSRYSMCYMDFETIDFEDKFQDIEKASLKTQDTWESILGRWPSRLASVKKKHSIEGAIFFPIHPMSTNENHLWFVGKLRNHPGVAQRLKHPSVRLWKGPDVKDRDHLDGDSRRGLKSKTYNYIYICTVYIYIYTITYSTIGLFIHLIIHPFSLYTHLPF